MKNSEVQAGEFDFLVGGGQMGGLIRAFDWAKTPLGAIAAWPQSLKTSISLMLNSQHPMWIGWGPEITFLYNDAYIQVLSLAKHPQALGKPAAEVWQEIWDICGPLADKVFQRGEASFVSDVRLFMNRGDFLEETFYSFSYSPIRDESGRVGGLFCPSAEVTAKLLNARRLRTLSELAAGSLAEKSTDAACASAATILAKNPDDLPFALFYLIDGEGKLARLEQSVGIEKGRALVNPETVVLASEGLLWRMADVLGTAQSQIVGVQGLEGIPAGAAGQPVTEALVLPLVSRGQERPLGILVAGVNPTRKLDPEYRAFYDLMASHVATAIQNARATAEEKKRADMLAELDRAKTTFFSNISHELRTPLTLILGPLEDEMRESGVPRERLELAHRNSLRLLKLVNTLLDFSRIEAGRIEASFEPTDLSGFTSELASAFRSGMERAGLRLVVDCPPLPAPAFVDRDMWEKMVFNLLSNAFKFTSQGEIEIKLREVETPPAADDGREYHPSTARDICLTVRDTGTGIPPAELPRVFERFHRVRNAWSRSHEGTGIGLALVQELARQHGGHVQAESVEGHGSTFTIQIPAGKAHLPAEKISGGRTLASTSDGARPYVEEAMRWLPDVPADLVRLDGTPGEARPLILLADDNWDMREYVRRLLVTQGCDVLAVENGQAALEAMRVNRPGLVLSDVMMPLLDGFELLQVLRKDPATRTIPVILMSARAGEEARVEGMEAGADDYLTKPFSARELVARVKTHLELARMRQAAEESLRRAHHRLQNVLGSITDGLAVLNQDWCYTYLSTQAARILGMEPEELLGHCAWDLFPWAVGTKFYECYHRAVATGETVHFEEFYPAPLNKWLECRCYPSDEGLSVYFHDITERKRREHTLVFLAEMEKALALVSTSAALIQHAGERVVAHLGLTHCLLVEIDETVGTATVLHDQHGPEAPGLEGVYQISDFHTPEEQRDMAAGKTIVIDDVHANPRSADRAEQFEALGIGSLANASCTWNGRWKFVVSALRSEPRVWPPEEIELLTELAPRLYLRLERIRAEERLRESEERFRSVFEHAATGIAITTMQGKFERCNPAYAALLGYTEKELQALDFKQLIHPEDAPQNLAEIRRLQNGELPDFEIENRYIRKDGSFLWVHKFVSLLRDDRGRPARFVTLVTDVTERRRAETALQAAKEAAEAANSSKDRFLATLSHELRTPLTPVLMTAAALQEDPRLPREMREQLGMMERNIALEARLIDDLLDISAISRGKLHLRKQPCDAHSLIELALEIVRDEAAAKEIVIARKLDAPNSGLQTDPARFQQVVWNLLRNAVKFTPRGGRVAICTSEITGNDDRPWLRMMVTDSGIGIEPGSLEKIFQPFEQGAVTGDHRFGGMGLGLAIARAIVDLQGGRINARSEGHNQGATFVVDLPGAMAAPAGIVERLDSPDGVEKGNAPAPQPAGLSRRLLVVEDHPATLQVISTLLRRSGYHVTVATNVTEALAQAAQNQFDLVVSDLGLPDGSGIQLMEELRARHGVRGIALTGYGMESDIARAREAGFLAHIVKPVQIAELRRVLDSLSEARGEPAGGEQNPVQVETTDGHE